MERYKVLVVDDDAQLCREVIAVLSEHPDLEVVGEAEDGAEAVQKARELAPDIVVLDLRMPGMGGIQATSVLRNELPETQVLIFTISDFDDDLVRAIRSGAKGYILKDANRDELVQAILHVAKGGVIISPSMAAKLLGEVALESGERENALGARLAVLSTQELQMLQLVSVGLGDLNMAGPLGMTEEMVKTQLRDILDKLRP